MTYGVGAPAAADALVIFGITGDLARVMTFRSLYRLERRGLLDVPIVGVAVDDWTVEQLREHARDVDRRDRGGARRRGLRPAGRAAVVPGRRLRRRRDLRARLRRRSRAPRRRSSTSRSRPSSSAGSSAGSPAPELTANARIVIEKPFGHDLESARALAARAARVRRRVAALPDRPLPREDGPRGDPLPPLRERDARAALEPQLRRERPDHDGRELRRRGSRPLLRPGRRAARRRRQPPDAGARRRRDGAARRAATRARSRTRRSALFQAVAERRPGAVRPRPVRRLPSNRRRRAGLARPRPTPRCGSTSRTGAGRACRSSSARGSALPVTQTEMRLRVQAPAAARLRRARRQRPEPNQLVVQLDPTTGVRFRLQAPRADTVDPSTIDARHASSPTRAARGRRRTRCCCTPRSSATAPTSPARTASRRRGASCSRCSTIHRRWSRTRPGRGGRRRPTASSPATRPGTSRGSTARGVVSTTPGAERQRVETFGRLEDGLRQAGDWYHWGPYLSERQWGTVREDYSAGGDGVGVLPARPRPLARVPLGRGRARRLLRRRAAALPRRSRSGTAATRS